MLIYKTPDSVFLITVVFGPACENLNCGLIPQDTCYVPPTQVFSNYVYHGMKPYCEFPTA